MLYLRTADGTIVCTTRGVVRPEATCPCGKPATRLCDFPMTGARSGTTCDRPMCAWCAWRASKNLDYCDEHREVMQAQAATR